MRKNYLLKPNVNVKKFNVKNLSSITEYAEGMTIGNTLASSNMCVVESIPIQFVVKNMYCVNNKMYAQGADGYFYAKSGDGYFKRFECGTEKAIMGSVILQGARQTLYIDNTGGRVLENDKLLVRLPYGEYFATHALRCFSAKDYTIYFSSKFDFIAKSMAVDNYGNLSVNTEDGKIIGLYDFSSYLLIVCTNAFYKLTVVNGEFYLEKINTDSYEIQTQSLARIGGKLLFISDKKLYAYENFSIKQLSTTFVEHILTVDIPATSYNTFYFCQTCDDEKKCVYVYDVVKKKDWLVYVSDSTLKLNNIMFNETEQKLYLIEPNPNTTAIWRSKAISFATNDKKSLMQLSINVTKDSMLKIIGDFGVRDFVLKSGINNKKMNLRSKEFTLELVCLTTDIVVSNLEMKYME